MSTPGRKDWILWGALACTLVGTAHAEYTLAMALPGANWFVAAAVPGALDLYVIRALQIHRDVFVSVMVMVAVNVLSRLVTAGIVPMDWRTISAVGALAPLLLWRIHSLWFGRVRTRSEILHDVPAGTPEVQAGTEDADWDETYLPAEWTEGYVSGAVSAPGASSVPAYPSAGVHPGTPAGQTVPDVPADECEACADEHFLGPCRDHAPEVYPPVLPELPPGFEAGTPVGTVRYSQVQPADRSRLPMFEAYLLTCQEEGSTPTIRGTKEAIGCSQTVAKRYMGYAGYPVEVQEVQR